MTQQAPGVADIAAALRQISRGFAALANAVDQDPAGLSESDRYQSVLHEWGHRGLGRAETSALLRKHGFSPQAAGGWVRGEWLETRADGRRYLTARSRRWLAEQEVGNV
ncbi:hypothetical protein EV191_103237 [Tamaricihabitans halophyticus]|uniref:Uncharacterized protein n=1 Tax=Tamaricihabitans halophyticus TaxID=1262583 RepID=A0A4R2QXU9_9PSEU|nr:hypothetical protein [Tamaricihabitans halophyticus]TCP54194.1 hypothetical protein EV191_103237 [Tamaricihabitans halophyticus]